MKTAEDVKDFLNELSLSKNNKVVYLLNEEDNEYYMIKDMRIDPDGDVVFDISL